MTVFKIDGSLPLAKVARRIRDIEITRNRFVGCSIEADGTNHVDFAQDDVPPVFELLPAGQTPSWPADVAWSGKVRASGNDIGVSLYRKRVATGAVATTASDTGAIAFSIAGEMAAASGTLFGRADVVRRALTAVDTQTAYESPGVVPPLSAERWPDGGAATDCSGFVTWCLRMSRRTDHPLYRKLNGGWIDTSALHRDGLEQTGLFRAAKRAVPGSLVVYPDIGEKQGHVGVVIEANANGVAGIVRVVHCSIGNFKAGGKAILATNAQVWVKRKDSLIIDYEGFID
ncbi:MAG TPA: CHAP domain-containing protein [Tahibacter sp.]|nr:CHAP domain-containing protein [Tahibacter sp.]